MKSNSVCYHASDSKTNQRKVKCYKETIKELAIYSATSMFYLDSLNSLANVEEPVKRKKKLVNGKNICKWLLRNVGKWNVADHTLHTVGYTQRDNHSAIVSVKGKGTFKGSVPGDFFPRSASTSDVKAAASDMLRPTQTKHVSNFQATTSFFFL